MRLPKYLSLLQNQSLFFSPGHLLGDPFEGTFPTADADYFAEVLAQRSAAQVEVARLIREQVGRDIPPSNNDTLWRKWCGVSCWSIDEHESMAMWQAYVGDTEGVAVKSSFALLKVAFAGYAEPTFMGAVAYIDFEKDRLPDLNAFTPLLHKRIGYRWEQELRVVIFRPPGGAFAGFDVFNPTAYEPFGDGLHVSIDVNAVVQEVRVAPTAPGWLQDTIKDATVKFGGIFDVNPSELSRKPRFGP